MDRRKTKTIVLLGAVIGFANGLFGSGGGAIAVPLMQRYLGIETHKSHATAIAIILPLSLMSLFIYAKHSVPDYMMLMYVSAGGVVGGFFGAKLLKNISPAWLHRVFGAFMIAAALRMIF